MNPTTYKIKPEESAGFLNSFEVTSVKGLRSDQLVSDLWLVLLRLVEAVLLFRGGIDGGQRSVPHAGECSL